MGNDLGMQYIMDGNGNYYTVNGSGQLVVAKDRDEAGVFTFFEANQRIGGGKKAKFYHTIPVDTLEDMEREMLEGASSINVFHVVNNIQQEEALSETTEEVLSKPMEEAPVENEKYISYEYDIEHVDWVEFTNYYIYLMSAVKEYQERLAGRHSDVEKEICDLLHYVELYDLDDGEALRAVDLLKDARQRRRDIKDEMTRTEFFQKNIGTSAILAKAKGYLTELKKLDTRKYHPRQLPELFSGMEDRITDRNRYRENRDVYLQELTGYEDDYQEKMERQQMSFSKTIYDKKDNDWLGFVKQQLEFYQNAGQYMMNLEIRLDAIDSEIEKIMEQIEDANYNVTQGYKVFKDLKILRIERKEKERELQILRTMTEYFDCNSMADTYAYIVDEIGKITGCETEENILPGMAM